MAKYLDPKADVTFKKVFGEHKNLVISLLNALLPLDEGKQIEALEIVRESGMNDAERAAYEGFWDRVSIETTKKVSFERAIAERDAAVARADAAETELNAATAERDAATARADAAEAKLQQDKHQTARQMKSDGMSVESIAKYTGLSADEIENL
jgi:exonuclease VII small subunit